MAYFFWGDAGVSALVNTYEPDFLDDFQKMFSRVEQVDIFRVLACKWFGGIVRPTLSPRCFHCGWKLVYGLDIYWIALLLTWVIVRRH